MEKEANLAIKYWPIGTLGAVVLCIAYVAGIFHYPGEEFLTLLTFTDYVSIALPALPYILFLIIANLVMSDDPMLKEIENRERFEAYERQQQEKPLEERDWYKREKASKKLEGAITLTTPMAILAYWLVSNLLPPQFSLVSFLLLAIACALLIFGFLKVAAKRHIALGMACIGAFAVLGLFYSSGLYVGSRAYTGSPDTILRLADGTSRCVNVLAHTRHGPIVVSGGMKASIVSWNEVTDLSRSYGMMCRETPSA